MKAGTLFRVGMYLIGVWALFHAAGNGVGFLAAYARDFDSGLGWFAQMHGANVIGQLLAPLTFAVAVFGFGRRLQTRLLGRTEDESLGNAETAPERLLAIGLKLLGLYLLAIYGGPQLATLFELVVVRGSQSRAFEEPQVIADLIANTTGLVAGGYFAFRTEALLGRLAARRAAPPTPPPAA